MSKTRKAWLMVLTIGLVIVSSVQSAEKVLDKAELKKLQGRWVVQSKETSEGKHFLTEKDEKEILEIDGVKWIFTGVEKGKITAIDPTAKPKRLDIVSVEPGDAGTVYLAIYTLKGDTLTVCMPLGEVDRRPKNFDSPPQPGTGLIVFHRLKKK